jgi:methylated-DNA-[protein]-cysteine S-methyltransferase
MPVVRTVIDSPIGPLGLSARGDVLVGVTFHADWEPEPVAWERTPVLTETRRQLDAYFRGALTSFSVPVAPSGTPFQQEVWAALQAIPYGTTTSYRDLAATIRRPAAVRAVGAANGQNPIPIIIPCHRVIGSDGRLVGFGGGLDTKRRLLDLEQRGRLF